MPCVIRLHENKFKLPKTLIKDFDLLLYKSDGSIKTRAYRNVHARFLKLTISGEYTAVRFVPLATYGDESFRLFDFEIF